MWGMGQWVRPQGRIAGIHRFHRHRALWLDHLHVRREGHDDLRQGSVIDLSTLTTLSISGQGGQPGQGGRLAYWPR